MNQLPSLSSSQRHREKAGKHALPGLFRAAAAGSLLLLFTFGASAPLPAAPDADPAAPRVQRNARDGAEMVWVPPGAFQMGSEPAEIEDAWGRFHWPAEKKPRTEPELPAHRVEVDGYWIYRDEVTVAQFRKFAQKTGREMPDPPEWGWDDHHPVVNVNWEDATAYCAWAEARLPTEAEWERAARGDDTGLEGKPHHLFVWGDAAPTGNGGFGSLPDQRLRERYPQREIFAEYNDGFVFTAPVGSFPASSQGLHDMAGNVFEWCADWYDAAYYRSSPNQNPQGPPKGDFRSLRGGSWLSDPYGLRIAYRYYELPGYTSYYVGFRPVRDGKEP